MLLDGLDDNRELIFTSLVRHIDFIGMRCVSSPTDSLVEGDVVVVRVDEAVGYAVGAGFLSSSLVEDRSGTLRVLYKGGCVVTAVGNRESTFWTVAELSAGSGPKMNLVSHAGLCSYLTSGQTNRVTAVSVIGRVAEKDGTLLNVKRKYVAPERAAVYRKRAVSVFCGTSAEVGKTTTLLHILRKIRAGEPGATILAIKLSGTPSEAEINLYKSYGANSVVNLVDLGFPSSYTLDYGLLRERVEDLVSSRLFVETDHVLVELGGDVIGGRNDDLVRLLTSNTNATFVLSAFDCFGAEGCSRHLKARGVNVAAITGKCTANTIVKQRTRELCRVPALSVFDEDDLVQLVSLHGQAKRRYECRSAT